jgi:hypothetical protein
MKYFIAALLVIVSLNDPIKIRKINTAKTEAKKAFNAGDYKGAIEMYRFLMDSLGVDEEEVKLNLANAYFLQTDTTHASSLYQSLTGSTKKDINSKAHQQLGIMSNKIGKAEEALGYFKQAVKADPSNEEARYNYEMLKKKLAERKKEEEQQNKDQEKKDEQNKDKQNQDQQKKDQEKKEQEKKDQEKKDQEKKGQEKKDQEKKDQEKKDQEQKDQNKDQEEKEKKDQEKKEPQDQKSKEEQKKDLDNLDREKLEQMKISEEKAKMILEAMKNQEKQYLQQQKRKATKSRDKNKPDW